jgi:Xaa-Pro aminopeptidase
MVITAEPGLYFSGKFGIRIEDMAVLKSGNLIVLSKSPKDNPVLT